MVLKTPNVSFQSFKPYTTLNRLTSETKNIWMVFHGMGHLSLHFLKPFAKLNAKENYFIAPQAPSKYYLDHNYKYVGASWLTREDLEIEIENVLNYVDSVFEAENILKDKKLILLGFSQGVSIVTRWMSKKKVQCDKLLLYAGGIPNELQSTDFDFLDMEAASVKVIYGSKDKFITTERILSEEQKIQKLFGDKAEIIKYDGGHEIDPEILGRLL